MSEHALIKVRSVAAFRQLGFVVADGSGSMTLPVDGKYAGSKGQAVGFAVNDLLSRFAASRKAANFTFGGVAFDETPHAAWGPAPVAKLDTLLDRDPTLEAGGGTRLASGLTAAAAAVEDFLRQDVDGLPSSAVVLALTDGEDGDPDAARAAAARLVENPRVKLACAFLATKGQPATGLPLLRSICSQPAAAWCTVVYDAETLRKFWIASMTAAAPEPSTVLSADEVVNGELMPFGGNGR